MNPMELSIILKSRYRTRRIFRILVGSCSIILFAALLQYDIPTTTSTTFAATLPTKNNRPRQLEEEQSVNNNNDDTFLYNDLSTYSIRYEKCQFVKMYDDTLASNQQQEQEQSSSPLATKHFVIYRLCPSDTCSSSSSSSSSSNACGTDANVPYGTYTMTVEEYLYYTINYQKELLEQSCNFCNAYCVSTSSSSSSSSPYCTTDCTNTMCQSCSTTCDAYQSFTTAIANGATNIADAANYMQCQPVENSNNNNNNDDDDDDDANNSNNNMNEDDTTTAIQYYIGPYCQSTRTTSTDTAPTSISIGLFADEHCYSPVTDVNMTEVLGGIHLSYHLFQHTTTSPSSTTTATQNPRQCLSCLETTNDNNNNNNDANDADNVNEMCENLYTVSAKCESTTGLQNGFIQMHRDNNNQQQGSGVRQNQVENEFMVCTFLQSLLYNSYTETGVIDIRVTQDYIARTITHRQSMTLVFVWLLLLSLIGTIYYYHHQIVLLQQQQQQQLVHPSSMLATTTRRDKKTLLIREGELS